MVKLDLVFDMNTAIENRRLDSSFDGSLSFLDQQGQQQEWSVNISLRGKFRRVNCQEMPPLKIDFSKKDLKKAGLAPFDDLKIVTYCMDDKVEAKEALLKEYLMYKLYNQLTEISYRVQLVEINFKDIHTGQRKKLLSFLIEDTAQLTNRIGAEKLDSARIIDKNRFDTYYQQTTALFQYMIGNKDWGLTFGKNIKYLNKNDRVILVPFDFDFAEIVGASYTAPNKNAENPFVHGRVYQGFREEIKSLQPVINEFNAKRTELFNVIRNCKLLRSTTRKKMISYLESFFEDPNNIQFAENMF